MPFYTPLRYPGGKRRLAPVVIRLLEANRLTNIQYAEPYAGGSAIALALLFEEHAAAVHINDLSRPIYAFWHTVLNDTANLCRRVERVKVTMREWHRQRAVYDARASADLADLGFAALFLNRTNRSGIVGGGVIGGKAQLGAWGLDARFGKGELIERIRRIGRYRNRINLYQQDALHFTQNVVPNLGPSSFTFFDPPYIENSADLYLNTYNIDGHRQLATGITNVRQPWVVTYDHVAIRENLYPLQRRMVYGLSYSAHSRYKGAEVMFVADGLKLPADWRPSRRIALSRADSEYPVYGKMENMKPHPEMEEGQAALDRFRKAMKTIVAVPKGSVVPDRPKARAKRKKAASRKG